MCKFVLFNVCCLHTDKRDGFIFQMLQMRKTYIHTYIHSVFLFLYMYVSAFIVKIFVSLKPSTVELHLSVR